ncbi:MAG: hypothetical protein ACP5D9_18900, partial [Mariniphaga sp.]
MSNLWSFNEIDKKLSEQFSGFLPDRIFDIHAHIYRVSDLSLSGPSVFKNGPSDVSVDVWRTQSEKFLCGKKLEGGLFFPTPTTNLDLENANNYLLSQIKKNKQSRGLVMVSPDMNPEDLSFLLKHSGIVGIKPYHLFSKEHPTWESSVSGFLPEWQMKLADAHSSIVMLHLVKNKSIADPDNIKEIRGMCTRYPRIKLILAHAARSFHAPHAKEGIKKLRGLDNIWFDLSGICEHEALLE